MELGTNPLEVENNEVFSRGTCRAQIFRREFPTFVHLKKKEESFSLDFRYKKLFEFKVVKLKDLGHHFLTIFIHIPSFTLTMFRYMTN